MTEGGTAADAGNADGGEAAVWVRPGMETTRDGRVRRANRAAVKRPDLVRDEDGLTERERAFADRLIDAAMRGEKVDVGEIWQEVSGCADATRSVGAALALGRPKVRGYLRKTFEAAIEALTPAALGALVRLLRTSRSEYVTIEVAKMLLGLAGYRPADRVHADEIQGMQINITIAPPDGETGASVCIDGAPVDACGTKD